MGIAPPVGKQFRDFFFKIKLRLGKRKPGGFSGINKYAFLFLRRSIFLLPALLPKKNHDDLKLFNLRILYLLRKYDL